MKPLNNILYLIRGICGSGKSTVAETLSKYVCTADDYFMKDNVYQFDPKKLSESHEACIRKCEEGMKMGVNKIAVANTFVEEWEMERYFHLANEYGYNVFSLIVENRHNGKNIHGVPDEKIKKMKKRFQVKLI